MTAVQPWTELLSHRYPDEGNVYGAHTDALCSAMDALGDTQWFTRVGEPLEQPVDLVPDWAHALAMFDDMDDAKYGPNGHLIEPAERCWKIINSAERRAVWERARTDVNEYVVYSAFIPESLSQKRQDQLDLYLYEFLSFLIAEIIAGDEMTYFREQLQWFHDGRLPCGWSGKWPNGRMRVF